MKYGVKKHLETFFKGFSFPKDQLSAVPPEQYAERFVKFIRTSIKTKEEMGQHTKEDLSHTAIPEESPIGTPSNEKTLLPHKANNDVEVVRTVVSPQDRPDQQLPAITIQHPSPEMREGEFDKEIQKGIQKPMVNGWSEGYFGEKVNAKVKANGVVV